MYDELVKRLNVFRLKEDEYQIIPVYVSEIIGEAADAIEELMRRCEQLQYIPPPAWIPVTERLPEENGNYLVAVKCPRGKWVEICACDGRDWVSVDEYAEYATKWVTHWMPLPQPPKEE